MAIVSTPKVMVSIFWSPIGFPVIPALLPKTKFSSASFCDDFIPKIIEGTSFDSAKSPRKLMLPMDNATRHRACNARVLQEIQIHPIRSPPGSPDLAPSDFYLFEKLKGAFAGREFVSTEELLLAIRVFTRSIEGAELESVF
jgi:hypothetical protein